MDDIAVIDRFTDVFSRYIDSGFGLLHGEVGYLTAALIVIDITLAGLSWALDHAGGGHDVVLAKLIRKTLYISVFAYIINDFNTLAGILFRSFAGLGLTASGSTVTLAQFLQPGQLAQVGVETAAPLLAEVGRLSGFTTVFANFETIVVLLVTWFIVIVSFFVLAVQLFITLIEFKLTTLAGFVLIPFALWNKTAFLAEKVLGNVIASGIKVLVLAVIVGIGTLVFNDFRTAISSTPTMNEAAAVMLASLAMLGLGIFGPGIATGLVSGAPQLGAGAAVGTTMAAGGLAVAGAMAAGGAGRMASAGLRGGIRSVWAAASMASSARSAYVDAAAASGQSGARAAAAGMAGVARAGASAAGERLQPRTAGAAPDTQSASGAPAWAKRAQTRQHASHGAMLAAHTVRSGDAGGNSSGPSLRDDSN